jgi:hypothetical protein
VSRGPARQAEDSQFFRLYGPWARTRPADAARLLTGFERPWWISGGWAIEAFTGVHRAHDDVDLTVFRADVGALRSHFAGTHDLWAAGSGTLRPLTDERPRVPAWAGQVWVRAHSLAPWLLDVVLNAGSARGWVFKREPSYIRPLDEVTWTAADGLRYLAPEIVLAHKVRLARPKDDLDLDAAVPRLDAAALDWLRSYVRRAAPDHPWLARLG